MREGRTVTVTVTKKFSVHVPEEVVNRLLREYVKAPENAQVDIEYDYACSGATVSWSETTTEEA